MARHQTKKVQAQFNKLPTFVEACELVFPAVHENDGLFPALSGIKVESPGQVIATDGHRLFVCQFDPGGVEIPTSGILVGPHTRALTGAKSLMEGKGKDQKPLKFPEWQRVIPAEQHRKPFFSGPAAVLLAETKRFVKMAGLGSNDPIVLKAGEFGKVQLATIECRDSAPVGSVGLDKAEFKAGFSFNINSAYLIDMMQVCAKFGDTFDFQARDAYGPLILGVGPMLTLTMPVRL